VKGAVVKRLVESIGGARAATKFREGLAGLEARRKKLEEEREALGVELEARLATGEDASDLASRIVAAEEELKKLGLSRAPLEKLRGEADAAEAAKAEEEKRAAWAIRLQAKREEGRTLHDAVVDHFVAALRGLVRLDVLEREALALACRCGDMGFDFEADPSRIAQKVMSRVLSELPPWVANARLGEVAVEPLVFNVYRRVLPPERLES
jgi:hypothetical protein